MPRGGLHPDPEIRARQLEGLAVGRQTAAERRRQGLPSKRAEAEAAARVIEGGKRDGDRRRKDDESGASSTGTRRRRQSTSTGTRRSQSGEGRRDDRRGDE